MLTSHEMTVTKTNMYIMRSALSSSTVLLDRIRLSDNRAVLLCHFGDELGKTALRLNLTSTVLDKLSTVRTSALLTPR